MQFSDPKIQSNKFKICHYIVVCHLYYNDSNQVQRKLCCFFKKMDDKLVSICPHIINEEREKSECNVIVASQYIRSNFKAKQFVVINLRGFFFSNTRKTC